MNIYKAQTYNKLHWLLYAQKINPYQADVIVHNKKLQDKVDRLDLFRPNSIPGLGRDVVEPRRIEVWIDALGGYYGEFIIPDEAKDAMDAAALSFSLNDALRNSIIILNKLDSTKFNGTSKCALINMLKNYKHYSVDAILKGLETPIQKTKSKTLIKLRQLLNAQRVEIEESLDDDI